MKFHQDSALQQKECCALSLLLARCPHPAIYNISTRRRPCAWRGCPRAPRSRRFNDGNAGGKRAGQLFTTSSQFTAATLFPCGARTWTSTSSQFAPFATVSCHARHGSVIGHQCTRWWVSEDPNWYEGAAGRGRGAERAVTSGRQHCQRQRRALVGDDKCLGQELCFH